MSLRHIPTGSVRLREAVSPALRRRRIPRSGNPRTSPRLPLARRSGFGRRGPHLGCRTGRRPKGSQCRHVTPRSAADHQGRSRTRWGTQAPLHRGQSSAGRRPRHLREVVQRCRHGYQEARQTTRQGRAELADQHSQGSAPGTRLGAPGAKPPWVAGGEKSPSPACAHVRAPRRSWRRYGQSARREARAATQALRRPANHRSQVLPEVLSGSRSALSRRPRTASRHRCTRTRTIEALRPLQPDLTGHGSPSGTRSGRVSRPWPRRVHLRRHGTGHQLPSIRSQYVGAQYGSPSECRCRETLPGAIVSSRGRG